jgi:hypothetical protein
MTDDLINRLHEGLWALIESLMALFRIAPYIGVFCILSLVFTGLVLAIRRQHKEQTEKDNASGNL